MSEQVKREEGPLTHGAWARALREGDLLGQRCRDCGHVTAAPKAACVRCGGRDSDVVDLPRTGEVYASTTVHVAPVPFDDDGPYDVALVDVGEARLMAHVDGAVDIGDEVAFDGVVENETDVGPVFAPTSE